MKHRIRHNDFRPLWSALRLPSSGWVSEQLTGYLVRLDRHLPRTGRDHKIARHKMAGDRRQIFQCTPKHPGKDACRGAVCCS